MNLISIFLAALGLLPMIQALPSMQSSPEVFSFSKWIEGIILNPDGDNLTPDAAVEAWRASLNNTQAGKSVNQVLRYACGCFLTFQLKPAH